MDTKIQFQKKATVLAADGQQIGSIERVVVNTTSNVLTDIVVRKGSVLDVEEKVVPIELVAETAPGQIVLRDTAGMLEGFPSFEERHLVDADNAQSSAEPPAVVGYPSLGVPMTVVRKEAATRMEQNIPDGTVAMKEGAKVISAEGKHVGSVECVVADSEVDQVTHLIVASGMLTKEKRLIPMKWVMSMGEDEVHLRVNKASVEEEADIPIAA